MPNYVDLVNQVMNEGKKLGVMHLSSGDDSMNGRTVRLHGKDLVNFGSCSYLGLEVDQRLSRAAIEAIQKYGTQFSSSRSYVSLDLYEELEAHLSQIFQQPTLASPTTSLGHISVLPIIVGSQDVVIKDQQVHASVQNALKMLKGQGIKVRSIPHNDMDALERQINKLKHKYKKIWYMADGVYSMYGDVFPVQAIEQLMDQHEQLHLYIDDAHGMSWAGTHGAGYLLSQMKFHPRMYMATSLNKAYASGGGALIFPNPEIRQVVRNVGASLVFSGPIQPSMLGAAIASAKIHLSPEIYELQNELKSKMDFFEQTAQKNNLLLINNAATPLFYIAVGRLDIAFKLHKRMMEAGFYMNIGLFPAVSYENSGMRVALNRRIDYKDMELMLNILAEELEIVLKEEGSSMEEVRAAFGLDKMVPQMV